MNTDVKPNVFLAGAPKCGTTSLANWLSEHPQCYVSPLKEPHFFGDFLRKNMSLARYERLFEAASSDHMVRIDASTSYFTKPDAIEQIVRYRSDARFIVMLRDPVELVQSLHAEVVYGGAETITSFCKAWEMEGERKRGRKIPISCNNPDMLFYRDQALLGSAMENLLSQAGISKVHWIFMEDLKADARQVYLDLLKFFDLEDDGRNEFPARNRSKKNRFPRLNRALRTAGLIRSRLGLPGVGARALLNRNARVEEQREPLSEDFRRILYASFEEDIGLLERLTGRDLSHWSAGKLEL